MNELPKIEKNIPIPDKLIRYGKNINFLNQLRVGDSFVVGKKVQSSINSTAYRMGIKLTRRSLGNGMTRVWRIK